MTEREGIALYIPAHRLADVVDILRCGIGARKDCADAETIQQLSQWCDRAEAYLAKSWLAEETE